MNEIVYEASTRTKVSVRDIRTPLCINLVVFSSTYILPGNGVAPLLKWSCPSLNILSITSTQDQVFPELSITSHYLEITSHY